MRSHNPLVASVEMGKKNDRVRLKRKGLKVKRKGAKNAMAGVEGQVGGVGAGERRGARAQEVTTRTTMTTSGWTTAPAAEVMGDKDAGPSAVSPSPSSSAAGTAALPANMSLLKALELMDAGTDEAGTMGAKWRAQKEATHRAYVEKQEAREAALAALGVEVADPEPPAMDEPRTAAKKERLAQSVSIRRRQKSKRAQKLDKAEASLEKLNARFERRIGKNSKRTQFKKLWK